MGKASAPPAPDYAGAAEATAAGNKAQSRYTTFANRPKEITPYGTKSWNRNTYFDQAAYDAAINAGANPDDLKKEDYIMDDWTSTTDYGPEAQAAIDKQLTLSNKYADLATTGLDKAWESLSDPTLDMSGIPARAMNVGQTAQDAIMSRLNPKFDQQEEALRQRMANQGITLGSEAYGNEQRQFQQGRNDAYLQAALQGINLDQQNRASALQEQAYSQDRPLNLINALRTGSQVQNPQFGNFAQQQYTPGADYMGATNAQYQAALDATNTENANTAGLMGGLFSLGGAALGSPWLGNKLFG